MDLDDLSPNSNSLCHGEAWCVENATAAASFADDAASPRTFNISEVNMPAFLHTVFGSETFWEITSFVLVLNSLRFLGVAMSGAIYYLILGTTTDPNTRQRLEQLDFFFNENTLVTQAIVNIFAWFLQITGRVALSMVNEGPTRTFKGIRNFDLDRIARFIIPLNRSVVFLWRGVFESLGMLFGWSAIVLIGQLIYGSEDGKKRMRREIKQRTNWQEVLMSDELLHQLLEARMSKIIANIDDKQVVELLGKQVLQALQ